MKQPKLRGDSLSLHAPRSLLTVKGASGLLLLLLLLLLLAAMGGGGC